MNQRINHNEAVGEWSTYLVGKTIYKWNGQLWTGLPYAQGYGRGIELTPLTEAERQYLDSRGVLKGLEGYPNPAAAALRAIPSEKRTQASRENGKLGGRPKNTK